MREPSDETLMAFCDGALDSSEEARVAALVAERADLQARVAIFRETGTRLGQLYREADLGPVPSSLVAVISGAAAARQGEVIDLAAVRSKREAGSAGVGGKSVRKPLWVRVGAVAAVVTMAVLTGNAWMTSQRGTDVSSTAAGAGDKLQALAMALETRSGGEFHAFGDGRGWQVNPKLTFKTKAGGFCREYDLVSPQAQSLTGVACREGAGRWSVKAEAVKAQLARPAKDAVPSNTVLAGASTSNVDRIVEDLKDGDVLDATAVARLTANGWKP